MNGRGQYAVPLHGGSLYSSPPWGGAPDETSYGWPYRGPRAFHGHDAPAYGRRGAWPPRREAPLGRGGLVVGDATNSRGTYGSRETVGLSLFHTVGDRDRLVEQVDTEFGQLYSELYRKMGADPSVLNQSEFLRDPAGWARRNQAAEATIKRSPLYPLWKDTVAPVWNEWKVFYKDQSSWEEWKTNWDVYENWRDRVAKLHAHVSTEVQRLTGDRIRTPSPTATPTTIWAEAEHLAERGAGAVAEGAGDVWKIAKYGAWAVLGIGAVVALSSVAANLRKGEDPAQKWVEYAGRGAKVAAL